MVGGRPGSELREQDEIHVVAVCAHLLRICRDLRRELDEALQIRWNAGTPRRTYVARAFELLGDPGTALDPQYLDALQLDAIATFLDDAVDRHDLALRSSDLAQVLDEHRGGYFFSWFAGRRIDARANDPFPVPPVEVVVEEMGSSRGLPPQADTLEVPRPLIAPLDGTPLLRLVPSDLGRFTVRLDARHHGVVDALFSASRPAAPGPDLLWAAAVPSCAILDDLTFDLVDDIDPPGFCSVRPKADRAASYRSRVLEVLDVAAGEGAAIICLPELSVDTETEEAVVRWFYDHPTVALLIAGSRHLTGMTRRNRARVLLRGLPPEDALVHDKFSSFSISLGGAVRDEWIERGATLTVVAGSRWSFSPLICKDFMEIVPRRVLADLRVRVLFVASMSPKTDLYVTSAAAIAQDCQALVFISNAPHALGDDVAIFARPRRGPVLRTSQQESIGIVHVSSTTGHAFRRGGPA